MADNIFQVSATQPAREQFLALLLFQHTNAAHSPVITTPADGAHGVLSSRPQTRQHLR
jgi:hypothetical protein